MIDLDSHACCARAFYLSRPLLAPYDCNTYPLPSVSVTAVCSISVICTSPWSEDSRRFDDDDVVVFFTLRVFFTSVTVCITSTSAISDSILLRAENMRSLIHGDFTSMHDTEHKPQSNTHKNTQQREREPRAREHACLQTGRDCKCEMISTQRQQAPQSSSAHRTQNYRRLISVVQKSAKPRVLCVLWDPRRADVARVKHRTAAAIVAIHTKIPKYSRIFVSTRARRRCFARARARVAFVGSRDGRRPNTRSTRERDRAARMLVCRHFRRLTIFYNYKFSAHAARLARSCSSLTRSRKHTLTQRKLR